LRWALKFLKFKAIENSRLKSGSEVASKSLINRPYICLKLYDGGTLDIQNSDNYNILETIINLITELGFIVVDLNPPKSLDDHDYPYFAEVLRPVGATKPSENLSQQTSLLKGSSGLICSYGGFTYLATALGIKSISLYSSRDTIWEQHQAVAEHVRYHLGVESILTDINLELDLTKKLIKGGFFNDQDDFGFTK
jgi:ADP-heptose:LPS heptosyltransferase